MHSLNEQKLRSALPEAITDRIVSLRIQGGAVSIVLEADDLNAPEREGLEQTTRQILQGVDGVKEARIALMAERNAKPTEGPKSPPADASHSAEQLASTTPQRCGPILLAVGSGKGGVGKSTLAANLAIALAQNGRKVGLVDADIHGPSLPRIMGNEGERPRSDGDKLTPVPSKWGVSLLSMGQLVEPDKAIAWRGPMAGRALEQMIDANWGDTEILVVDLPPGTGDVQLTMIQRHRPDGAVIVSTPQDLALIDATRAMQLFEVGDVPILGLVENMAGYACPECGAISDPFGKGGAEHAAMERGLRFLGRVPLAMTIRTGGDAGEPIAASDSPEADVFRNIARQIVDALALDA